MHSKLFPQQRQSPVLLLCCCGCRWGVRYSWGGRRDEEEHVGDEANVGDEAMRMKEGVMDDMNIVPLLATVILRFPVNHPAYFPSPARAWPVITMLLDNLMPQPHQGVYFSSLPSPSLPLVTRAYGGPLRLYSMTSCLNYVLLQRKVTDSRRRAGFLHAIIPATLPARYELVS
ncbi:hypothetical protein BDQ17DRAFT_1436840 [Cyathus striatus]|nr:hypothetical protein BDQ17DRAFT_1436840 [Cyathus striatus]